MCSKCSKSDLNDISLSVERLEDREVPAVVYWAYSSMSAGDWAIGSNWSSGQVPQASDDVVFDGTRATADCNWGDMGTSFFQNSGGSTLPMPNSITIKSNFSATLNVLADEEVGAGGLTEDGGNISQAGGTTLTVDGKLERSAGSLDDNAQGIAAAVYNGPVDISGPSFSVYNSWTFSSTATVAFHMSGTVTFATGCEITNRGTWTWTSGNIGAFDSDSFITNMGSLTANLGAGNTASCAMPIWDRLDNAYLRVASGTLNFTGSNVFSDNVSVDHTGGSLIINAGATLGATAGVLVSGGELNTYGSAVATIRGDVAISRGDIILCADNWPNACGQLNIVGALNMTGGTYDAKFSSNPFDADEITTTRNITLGGTAGLTMVSINLVRNQNGDYRVAPNLNAPILRTTGNRTAINGDFNRNNTDLSFNDGTNGTYIPNPVNAGGYGRYNIGTGEF